MPTKEEREHYIRRARRIYETELLPRYRGTHEGRYIVIDGRSGDHEIARDDHLTYHRLIRRHPDAVTFSTRVGKDSAGIITSFTFGAEQTDLENFTHLDETNAKPSPLMIKGELKGV